MKFLKSEVRSLKMLSEENEVLEKWSKLLEMLSEGNEVLEKWSKLLEKRQWSSWEVQVRNDIWRLESTVSIYKNMDIKSRPSTFHFLQFKDSYVYAKTRQSLTEIGMRTPSLQ